MTALEQITREFYRHVAAGNFDDVLTLLSDDISWTIPGPPSIPYAGTYCGKAGVKEFFQILAEHEDLQSFVPREFIVDEQQSVVCVLGSETAVAIPTGRRFTANWSELFWISDGLITRFEEHIDTHALAEAYDAAHATDRPPSPGRPNGIRPLATP